MTMRLKGFEHGYTDGTFQWVNNNIGFQYSNSSIITRWAWWASTLHMNRAGRRPGGRLPAWKPGAGNCSTASTPRWKVRASSTLLSVDGIIFIRHNRFVLWNEKAWRRSLDEFPEFLEPLVAELGRSERREGATLYMQGLLMPGERKSIEPMAARMGTDSQKLQQFIADSPWDDQAVWRAIRWEVVPVMEPLTTWIIDETGWLKQGKDSVGVAHQYCGAVGKQANCQRG